MFYYCINLFFVLHFSRVENLVAALGFPHQREREKEIPLCTGNSFLANCRWRPRRFPEESSKKNSLLRGKSLSISINDKGRKQLFVSPKTAAGKKVSFSLCRIEEEERPFHFFPSDRLLFYLFSMTATERWKQHGYKTTIRKL